MKQVRILLQKLRKMDSC